MMEPLNRHIQLDSSRSVVRYCHSRTLRELLAQHYNIQHSETEICRQSVGRAMRYIARQSPEQAHKMRELVKSASPALKEAGLRIEVIIGPAAPERHAARTAATSKPLSSKQRAAACRSVGLSIRTETATGLRRFFAIASTALPTKRQARECHV